MRSTPIGIAMLNDEREHVWSQNNPANMAVVNRWAEVLRDGLTNIDGSAPEVVVASRIITGVRVGAGDGRGTGPQGLQTDHNVLQRLELPVPGLAVHQLLRPGRSDPVPVQQQRQVPRQCGSSCDRRRASPGGTEDSQDRRRDRRPGHPAERLRLGSRLKRRYHHQERSLRPLRRALHGNGDRLLPPYPDHQSAGLQLLPDRSVSAW